MADGRKRRRILDGGREGGSAGPPGSLTRGRRTAAAETGTTARSGAENERPDASAARRGRAGNGGQGSHG